MEKEYEIEIKWRAFPLHPETPEDGISLDELFANANIDIPKMLNNLKGIANSLGLAFGERHNTYNSRLAQELGLWAESKGKGNAFHMAAFRTYFADGKNLAKTAVLLEITDSIGLDKSEADRVLHERTFRRDVDADWELSREKRVTAVPTFIMNNASLTGARPYNDLLRFVRDSSNDLVARA